MGKKRSKNDIYSGRKKIAQKKSSGEYQHAVYGTHMGRYQRHSHWLKKKSAERMQKTLKTKDAKAFGFSNVSVKKSGTIKRKKRKR